MAGLTRDGHAVGLLENALIARLVLTPTVQANRVGEPSTARQWHGSGKSTEARCS
jgi:hypothetical protein